MANYYVVENTSGFPSTLTIDGVDYTVTASKNVFGNTVALDLPPGDNKILIDPGRSSDLTVGKTIASGDRNVQVDFNGSTTNAQPATISFNNVAIKPTINVDAGEQVNWNVVNTPGGLLAKPLTVNVGEGGSFGDINSSSGGADQVINQGTVGDVELGGGLNGNDTYIGGAGSTAGDISSSGRFLTVNTGDGATISSINHGGGIINTKTTVTVGDDVTIGDISAPGTENAILELTAGDNARLGDITSGGGASRGGNDRIEVGDNAVIGTVDLNGGHDTLIAGDGLTIGNIEMGYGNDSINVGAGAVFAGRIVTGNDLAVAENDADTLIIGEGSTVTGYINTNTGDDYVDIGANTTLLGEGGSGAHALNTYTGNDTVIIRDGVVADKTIFTGADSDQVEVYGSGDYTVDMGSVSSAEERFQGAPWFGNEDLLIINILLSEVAALRDVLTAAGYRTRSDGPDSGYVGGWNRGEGLDWIWNGVTYKDAEWVQYRIICFAAGTMIETVTGAVAVEDLREGDLVVTRDNGLQRLRWIGSNAMSAGRLAASPSMQPIRIRRHALGKNVPSQDLLVSPQHRVLVRSKIAQKMFGTDEILVAAKQLLQVEGIDIASDLSEVTYYHFLFDRHEIVISNGAETESLYTGPEALKTVGAAALDEIFAIFPELRARDYAPVSARHLASGRMGRKLATRHAQNRKALVN
ncbi:MAG: Hint domain-containing protein [Paracoccus sp. (in: a-proteobacteria)]|nr:Hint domain-containing protein [Paracoccus sp. (in: a-proteobacteria)]